MGFNRDGRKDAIMMQDGEENKIKKNRQGRGHREYAMAELKQDYLTPRVIKLFRKYNIFLASQNKSKHLFSLIVKVTRPQSRSIKVESRVIVGAAIQRMDSSSTTKTTTRNQTKAAVMTDSF